MVVNMNGLECVNRLLLGYKHILRMISLNTSQPLLTLLHSQYTQTLNNLRRGKGKGKGKGKRRGKNKNKKKKNINNKNREEKEKSG